jgi:hypothetical protein
VLTGVQVDAVHLPAELNTRADYLSRLRTEGRTIAGFRGEFPELAAMPMVSLDVEDIVRLSNPELVLDNDESFNCWWLEVVAAVKPSPP